MPGQEVSVSTAILPRTSANGYREAGAYLNGETVMAIGGGICQVSSTVYNAVKNAGLVVLERHPHSMPVHYLPLGLDAAISSGSSTVNRSTVTGATGLMCFWSTCSTWGTVRFPATESTILFRL